MKIQSIILLELMICLSAVNCSAGASVSFIDTTINKTIILRNSESVEKSFGDVMQKLNTNKDLPDVYFTNSLGTESLRLVFYPGDAKNTISSFEVLTAGNAAKDQKLWPTSFASFITESGVKLGMTKEEIIKIKGSDFKVTDTGNEVLLEYVTDEKKDKDFLKRYNMPSYFAKYTFQNNRLVKFAFGFDYP